MAGPQPPSIAEHIEAWRAVLRGGDKYECVEAIEAVGRAGRSARALVPALAALLTSEDYVSCTARECSARRPRRN